MSSLPASGAVTDEKPGDPRHQFAAVLEQEYAAIMRRRAAGGERGPSSTESTTLEDQASVPKNLFGVALSGGGIRSASFCLGVLQALDARGLITRMDYLSTVSGGGYAGASMVAAMSHEDSRGQFPFSCAYKNKPVHGKQILQRRESQDEPTAQDVQDSEAIRHIRDHSRYLIPGGLSDILPSLAVVARGLAVNAFLILALIVPLATVTVAANPTAPDLRCSMFYQLIARLWSAGTPVCAAGWHPWPYAFGATIFLSLVTIAHLLLWGLYRCRNERHGDGSLPTEEVNSRGTRWARKLIILTVAVALMELQGPILAGLYDFLMHTDRQSAPVKISGALATLAAATAGLRGVLAGWIQKATGSETLGSQIRAGAAKLAFVAAGLIVPLLIYAGYLALSLWGIAWVESPLAWAHPYQVRPTFMGGTAWCVLLVVIAVLVLVHKLYKLFQNGSRTVSKIKQLAGLLREQMARNRGIWIPAGLILICLLTATWVLRSGEVPATWPTLQAYLIASASVLIFTSNFSENANALHRLYRERLNTAFRLGTDKKQLLKLSGLDEINAPYLLINTTLNTRQQSRRGASDPQPQSQKQALDPAKRGRNAEFFLFSRHFVGSDLTDYVPTECMEEHASQFDLAAAVAISGAAISSNMGRFKLGLARPTLALLNLRLGYWLPNPKYMGAKDALDPRWHDFLRAYLVAESFGLLSADASKIYLTDGGHLDNLGLYSLLKRQCRFILVADAEADPAMTFDALVDVQRFARIDLGVRIEINWQHLRDAAEQREETGRGQRIGNECSVHQNHYAVGRIDYGSDQPEGVLIYVKASVTGDEPDYVLAYERQHGTFPHETTGDQFFTEAQMEAYRALGFHATRRALAGPENTDAGDAAAHAAAGWHQCFNEALGLKPRLVGPLPDAEPQRNASHGP